jgi:sulfotransferase family protein
VSRNTWPIIVGGCHRSGTSLIRRILNAHSRIHCGPEVKFFRDFFGDYFDDPIRHLRFATTARSLLPEAGLLELLGGGFVALHERAAALEGKRRWADKNPENVLYLAEWQQLLDDRWVLVHVVRNPLDTLASMKERSFPLTIPASLEGRIAFYHRYTQAGLRFGEAHPSRYYCVLYESFVESPEPALQSLMRWLGEMLEPGQLEFNRVAHQTGLEDPKIAHTSGIHADSVGRWRDDLSTDEARLIWRGTRDLWRVVDPDGEHSPRGRDIDWLP